jgi:hypothetical protein
MVVDSHPVPSVPTLRFELLRLIFLTSLCFMRCDWFGALRTVMVGLMLGYFVGDLVTAVAHFIIDNYKPEDAGQSSLSIPMHGSTL